MIRNWYNPALKTKREITKYITWLQFTKGIRGKSNEQLFPNQYFEKADVSIWKQVYCFIIKLASMRLLAMLLSRCEQQKKSVIFAYVRYRRK